MSDRRLREAIPSHVRIESCVWAIRDKQRGSVLEALGRLGLPCPRKMAAVSLANVSKTPRPRADGRIAEYMALHRKTDRTHGVMQKDLPSGCGLPGGG